MIEVSGFVSVVHEIGESVVENKGKSALRPCGRQ